MSNPSLGGHGIRIIPYESSTTVAFYTEVYRTTTLLGIYIHANSSPTCSNKMTIYRDSVHGDKWDTVLRKIDLGVDIVDNDFVEMFDEQYYLVCGDFIRIDYENAEGRDINISLIVQEAKLHKSI